MSHRQDTTPIDPVSAARQFLIAERIGFLDMPTVEAQPSGLVEVILPVPGAFDPNQVIDPPDVRVLVSLETGATELVVQM